MGTKNLDDEYQGKYTGYEMMLIAASRTIMNDDIVFNAFHWPFLAVHMAKQLHAPDVFFAIETGMFQDQLVQPDKLPFSITDPVLVPNALYVGDSIDALAVLQRGEVTIALLSTSMVDKYGNCNTTTIGPYEKPIYRLPGGGGATEIAGLAKRLIWLLDDHSKRRFLNKVNYITDPGYLDGGDSRVKAGYPPDSGPEMIISPLCVMKFDPESKEAYLDALHPNVTVEKVIENTDWDLKIGDDVKQVKPPTIKEIKICRKTMREAIEQYYVLKPEWTTYIYD
jgi:glutaconate CoA-transferase subunit B